MGFEFTPSVKEKTESLWRFSIPALSQSFLLVGHTTEPAVLLDRAYINFQSIKLGSTHREMIYLVNNEPTVQSFSFVKKSCYSTGQQTRVKVNPIQGAVEPHSRQDLCLYVTHCDIRVLTFGFFYRLPIELSYTATLPQEFSFNLECRVKHKPTPLRLNLKAKGYQVKMRLSFTSPAGDIIDIPIHSQTTTNSEIQFGKVSSRNCYNKYKDPICMYIHSSM